MKKLTLLLFLALSFSIYAQDGTLDLTFGVGGVVKTNIDLGLVVQQKILNDQKTLVLRDRYIDDISKVTLMKFNEDGSIDQSFADNGILTITETTDSTKYISKDFDIQSDGKICLLTIEDIYATDTHEAGIKYLLYRFNANGTSDVSFGVDGMILVEYDERVGGIFRDNRVRIAENNKILLTLESENNSEIRQYDTNGNLDLDFGNNGIVSINGLGFNYGLEIDNSGNIYALYDSETSFYLVKYFSNGIPDLSFGDNGICMPPVPEEYTEYNENVLTLQKDNKILVGVNTFKLGNRFLVYRINQNGSLDATFSDDGFVELEISDYNDGDLERIIAMPDGDILVGVTDNAEKQKISLHKFEEDGSYNTDFGNNGIVIKESGEGIEETFGDFDVRSDDFYIVVVGKQLYNDESSLILARYLNSRTYSSKNVSGNVSGIWDVDSVYVNGDIVVPLNDTLIIKPGTKVYFTGEYKIDVYGTLTAKGTKSDSITFASESLEEISSYPYYEGFWYGITFHSTDENEQAPSSLDYCNIKYAYPTWLDEMSDRYGGGLIFYKSQINISNTTFTDCVDENIDKGVFTAIHSNGSINGLSFSKTTSYSAGTLVMLSSDINIENLNMDEAFGVYCDSSVVRIKNSVIKNGISYSQYGTFNAINSEVELTDCEISNNNGVGIFANFSTLKIDHTLIKNNAQDGGIFAESPSTFTNCEIIGNGSHGLRFQTIQNWGTTFTSEINNCVIAKNGATGIKFWSRNNANITNCTIADNNDPSGWGGIIGGEVDTHLKNCIVYNNGNDLNYQAGGLYTYSIIQGNYVGSDVATTNIENIVPLFRDAANGNYHLQSIACGDIANSAGIDAGDPTITDLVLDCETAGLGTYNSDIGAYGGANNRWDNDIVPQCYFSGEVSGVWDCETITVEGDITIPEGDTLKITSAVDKVLFTGPYQITVQGVLLAYGPENDLTDLGTNYIKFQGSDWRGIVFSSTNDREVGTSIIENCRFDYANRLNAPNPNGGALLIYNSDDVIVKQSVFYANAGRLGGAIYIENSDAFIEDCYFQLNGKEVGQTAGAITTAGGAMYVKNSNPYLHKLQFLDNYSIQGGGAIVLDNSSPTMSNILMTNNSTGGLGGGMQLVTGSSPIIVNMTSAENTAETAGGSFYLNPDSNPTIINSIMYGDSKPEIYLGGGTPDVTYSIIDAASSESYFGTGCLDENPYFASGSNYKLSNNNCSYSEGNTVVSPAIDAGHPDSLDVVLDCNNGLGTERADMGYYGGGLSTVHVGTLELLNKTQLFTVYPNPTQGFVTLDLLTTNTQDFTYSIYNYAGQLMETKHLIGQKQIRLDLSSYKAGIYLVKLEMNKQIYSKIIIRK